MVRDGLAAIVAAQRHLRVVGVAEDGANALERAEKLRPDVVLLDMRVPGLRGLGALHELRRAGPAARIVVMSTYKDGRYVRAALGAGAHHFVGKRASTASLIAAIRTVFAGERATLDAALQDDDLRSAREQEVAELCSLGHTSQEIAAQLGIGGSTVDTYRARVFRRLGVESRAELVDRLGVTKGQLARFRRVGGRVRGLRPRKGLEMHRAFLRFFSGRARTAPTHR